MVPLATPEALPAKSRLAVLSATTKVAPDANAKFGLPASVVACAAETELDVPVTWTVVALATPAALPTSSRLAALSATTSVAPDASAKFGFPAKVVAWAAVTELEVPVTWTVVPLATPVALPTSSRLAALSATTRVAPEPNAKFGLPANVLACAAVTVFDVPVTWTVVPLAMPVELPASRRLAALSATTRVAPEPTTKPVNAAREVACVAVTVFAVPVTVTDVNLLAVLSV